MILKSMKSSESKKSMVQTIGKKNNLPRTGFRIWDLGFGI